jgi:TolB-like protein
VASAVSIQNARARRLTFRFGSFELDRQSAELRKSGFKIKLPEQSFQILYLLLERANEVVTRDELRQRLWPAGTFVDFDAGLNSAIKRLRDALGDSVGKPRFVETLPRHGYRFIGRIEKPAAPPIESLAVLPFDNLTGSPTQDYFVDGMTDAVITHLAQISSMRVISRTSVMQYRGAKKPLAEIARELDVDAVVEGAVVRSAQRVRITAQLIHAATDRHLWARDYDRDLGDIVALQGEVARAIAHAIEVALTPQELARLRNPRRVNPKAYDAYLRARYYLYKQTPRAYAKALEHFEQAIAEDPNYALAYASLSECYRLLSFWGPLAPQESFPRAEAAAYKALELDPTLAKAHSAIAALAYRYRWDWAESDRAFRRALELSPNDSECRWMYSIFLWSAGLCEEALAEAQRARELDPRTPSTYAGMTFLWARQYDRAIAEFRRALESDPEFPDAHFRLGLAYTLKGDFRSGIQELRKAVTSSRRNPGYLARLGHAYGIAGKKLYARKILEELETRSRREYVSPVGIALVHLGLGHRDAALASLEHAFRIHDFDLVTRNPRLDPLRSDPRYQNLMRRIGLHEGHWSTGHL